MKFADKFISHTLRATGRFIQRWRRRLIALTLGMLAGLILLLAWPMRADTYLLGPVSGEMQDRHGHLLYAFLNANEQWRFHRPLEQISSHLIHATIAVEDQRFNSHHGVDPLAVLRAVRQNLMQQRVVSGASTVSMQVVKLSGHSGPGLAGKITQAVQAIRLELRTSKDQILEAYLNAAPYGRNLVGCEAAARRYYGKPAHELTLAEAALLAGLPQAPVRYDPIRHPNRARLRRNHVLQRMLQDEHITQAQHDRAVSEPVHAQWLPYPHRATHTALEFAPLIRKRGMVRMSLDKAIQKRAETIITDAIASRDGTITNGAAVVIDPSDASVLAWVGGADFHSAHGGQVDVCQARRSPGSTLKPFLYAFAMENDQLYPCEILLDGPLDYGLFAPENFERRYRGPVSASEALSDSLNTPAVNVLTRIGYGPAWEFLRRIGFHTLDREAETYGLGLILGGCDVRLHDLAQAYTMLAALGNHRPLKRFLDPELSPEMTSPVAVSATQVLSTGTALAIYDMLEQPLPGETLHDLAGTINRQTRVAWKTGTSNGYRDAWTFAYNRHYVVGVWLGNNDGSGSQHLVGIQAAAPVAARLFRSLPERNAPAWPVSGPWRRPVQVCAVSGLPATQWCPSCQTSPIPRNQFLLRKCDVHHPIGKAVFDDGPSVSTRWPSSAIEWNLSDIKAPKPLMAPSGESHPATVDSLAILAPVEGAEFILTGAEGGDRIRLRASGEEQEPLEWFINDRYLGRSTPNRPLMLTLTPGRHRLACMNPSGQTRAVDFKVLTSSEIP